MHLDLSFSLLRKGRAAGIIFNSFHDFKADTHLTSIPKHDLAAHRGLTAESCYSSLWAAVLPPAQSTGWTETTVVPAPASLHATTALQQAEDPLPLLHWTKAGAVLTTKHCCCSHKDEAFTCSGDSEVLLLSEPHLECFLLGTMQTSHLQRGPKEMVTKEKSAHMQSSPSAEHCKSPCCCNDHASFKI